MLTLSLFSNLSPLELQLLTPLQGVSPSYKEVRTTDGAQTSAIRRAQIRHGIKYVYVLRIRLCMLAEHGCLGPVQVEKNTGDSGAHHRVLD